MAGKTPLSARQAIRNLGEIIAMRDRGIVCDDREVVAVLRDYLIRVIDSPDLPPEPPIPECTGHIKVPPDSNDVLAAIAYTDLMARQPGTERRMEVDRYHTALSGLHGIYHAWIASLDLPEADADVEVPPALEQTPPDGAIGREALRAHLARDEIRTECEEVTFARGGVPYVYHSCPRCPHGRIKGFESRGGDADLIRLKLQRVHNLRCEDDHPNAPLIPAAPTQRPTISLRDVVADMLEYDGESWRWVRSLDGTYETFIGFDVYIDPAAPYVFGGNPLIRLEGRLKVVGMGRLDTTRVVSILREAAARWRTER